MAHADNTSPEVLQHAARQGISWMHKGALPHAHVQHPSSEKIAQHGLASSLGSPVPSLFNLTLFNEDAWLDSDITRVPALSKAHALIWKGFCSQQRSGDRPGVMLTRFMGCRSCKQILIPGSGAAEPHRAPLSCPLISIDLSVFL